MADNVHLSKEELEALLGEEGKASETGGRQVEGGVGEQTDIRRLLQAMQALHARVEMLEEQVKELRRQALPAQSRIERPAPAKPAPRPKTAPAQEHAEPRLSRVERYGRGRS
ncbi:hypothetical protein PA598K_03122 [Paenibacillus sp. 598K]|uniref:hypothetical protein n=1 Tax=Paenibacillus sp. 598K TaxID=1117987 RepID=UPI000FFAC8A2|nr:hypothetical protein [Paenibacillus sp. 598K]GBF74757.1 hypothetical protein PA598K_03122 [Paenibacillus sp. 598K]